MAKQKKAAPAKKVDVLAEVSKLVKKQGIEQPEVDKTLAIMRAYEEVRMMLVDTVIELTPAEVKNLYGLNANTEHFTTTKQTKLAGIEDNAKDDQTGPEILDLLEALADYNIDSLSDVDTDTNAPTDGQILVWSAAQNNWIPQNNNPGGGAGFDVIVAAKSSMTAATGSTYVAPATLGDAGVLTIADWASFKSLTLLLVQGEDYDNGANDFVLEIVDQSGGSNTWDPSLGLAGYDLVLPNIRARDAGATVLNLKEAASYGVAETPVDNAPSNAVSWDNGTLTLRFSGADLKGKSRNILTLTA